jgi:cytochrome c oxidase assembly factor CtaG
VSSWLVAAFLVVLVVPPWILARIFTAGHAGGVHARLLSAAALSLVKRSCKASLLDAIALIINYLGVPFGMAFTGWLFS